MSYLRLFIELRNENTGAGCGQARVELQDRLERVDCKVRCSLIGLMSGQTYEMALVCEQGGRYKEYPLGQFAANPRGQAGPMFRGSFDTQPGLIPVTEFKAVMVRSSDTDGRIVGYRFEPMLIPQRYEEPESETTVEAEPIAQQEIETLTEQEGAAESEIELETETVQEAAVLPVPAISEEPITLQEPVEEQEPAIVPPAAVGELAEEKTSAERASKAFVLEAFAPEAIYVLRDLSQVDLVCGDAGKRAFQRYRHLILAQQGQVNYLGIPSRFRPTQRMELADEGYTLFYTPHGDEPGFGEFGYWMKRL